MPVAQARWRHLPIRQIEDLGRAVPGADLEAVQMAGPRVAGSLAFADAGDVTYATALIDGRVTICGPLSRDGVTFVTGLRFGPGSRHWLNGVSDGEVTVLLPGDALDAYYTPGTLLLAATLPTRCLQVEAIRRESAHLRHATLRTGLRSAPLAAGPRTWLRNATMHLHRDSTGRCSTALGASMLHMVIDHCARTAGRGDARVHPKGRALVVHRARTFIRQNLAAPITLGMLSTAAGTSRRTLERAFQEVFEDSPYNHVLRLRLHRIRRDLATQADAGCTIAMVARRWGIKEPGRFSVWYRELFGEPPSATVAQSRKAMRTHLLQLPD